jgi:hypothetical protein
MNIFSSRSYALAFSVVCASTALAAPPSMSPYYTDLQNSHVEDATSKGIGQVNMITCIMAAMKPDALVNQGNYVALVDEAKCDPDGRSSSGNSGATSDGAQGAASYMTAIVNSSRTSNSDPMQVNIWVDERDADQNSTIFVHTAATQAPTDANPYGQFRLDYCGRPEGSSSCAMNGYLEGAASGISNFEIETRDGQSQTKALRLSAATTTSGSGRMQADEEGGQSVFSFGYNASLYRRSDGTDDTCFSRDASDPETGMSVWRYGMYDSTTGERINRNSGFPIEFTKSGTRYQGFLGYWGLSLPPDAAALLANGDTVDKVDYSTGNTPTRTSYTVLKSAGKLTRYTRQARTLQGIDQIAFTTFVGMEADTFFLGAQANVQYELHWDDVAGDFKVTGQMICGQNGCQTQALDVVQAVPASFWVPRGGVQGWSQALGGELFVDLHDVSGPIDSAATPVVYRTQAVVYPSDLPSTLYCVRDCPTEASMAAYFVAGTPEISPFVAATANNWNPTPAANIVSYSSDAATAMLIDGASQPVALADPAAFQQSPQFQGGVHSGRLFTTLADAECDIGSATYCDWRVNNIDVYYQWETGPNSWNQFAAVKDSGGNFVEFDAPLQVTYQVPTGAAYGQYSGKSIVLQYGGFGDLWGIPGVCVSRLTNEEVSCDTQDARYVPSFVIPFSLTQGQVTAGDTTYDVKWLEREIRFAKKDLSVCTTAGLTIPTGITLPTAADLKDPSDPTSDIYIGVKPTVTDAPRVIHGEVKY